VRVIAVILIISNLFAGQDSLFPSDPDSLLSENRIDSAIVISKRNSSGLLEISGAVVMESSLNSALPRFFGSTDALRGARYLPGVQLSSIYDSGIHIDGCENSHNSLSLNGVPVYGAQHFLGLFSIFPPSHFSKMTLKHSTALENRLGGEISMVTRDSIPCRVGGEFDIGIIEADGTLAIPIGRNSAIFTTFRRSFLNLLFGNQLKIDNNPFTYGLTDVIIGGIFRVGKNDRLQFDFYGGGDFFNCNFGTNINDSWGNTVGAISWDHIFNSASLSQKLYFSKYSNSLGISFLNFKKDIPSSISDAGYKAALTCGKGLSSGLNLVWLRSCPQLSPQSDSFEGNLWIRKEHNLLPRLDLNITLKGDCIVNSGSHFGFSPELEFLVNMSRAGKISLKAGMNHQYIFQTGLSDINLPVEFWLPAGEYSKPQRSMGVDLNYNVGLLDGMFSVSAGGYFKALSNQMEYDGHLLDLTDSNFKLSEHLLHGSGTNCGVNLMFHKNSGKLTGWLSYSYSRARRTFARNGSQKAYPASHDRPHEFKALASYRTGRWEFSGTFFLASGTPFTPVKAFCFISNRLISIFDEYNSGRMPSTVRFDLSANFYLNPAMTRGFNLSLYNVNCGRDILCYRMSKDYSTDSSTDVYSYSPVYIDLKCIPSVSFFIKF